MRGAWLVVWLVGCGDDMATIRDAPPALDASVDALPAVTFTVGMDWIALGDSKNCPCPVPGADVNVVTEAGEVLRSTVTDDNGNATLDEFVPPAPWHLEIAHPTSFRGYMFQRTFDYFDDGVGSTTRLMRPGRYGVGIASRDWTQVLHNLAGGIIVDSTKGDVHVFILDRDGNPVGGASIAIDGPGSVFYGDPCCTVMQNATATDTSGGAYIFNAAPGLLTVTTTHLGVSHPSHVIVSADGAVGLTVWLP